LPQQHHDGKAGSEGKDISGLTQSTFPLNALVNDLLQTRLSGLSENEGKESSVPHWSRIVGVGALVLGWIGMSVATFAGISLLMYPTLILLVVGVIAAIVGAISNAKNTVREWKTMEVDIVRDVGKNMSRWYETIRKVQRAYTPQQIKFAQDYFTAVASDSRLRLAVFVGALEKVGLIPLVATVFVTFAQLKSGGSYSLFLWYTAAVIGGGFYLVALKFVEVALTLERFAAVLKHAADVHE